MGDYFIGEIRLFPYNRIPSGWRLCDGAVLPVAQNQALYALLGNQFGGSPPTTFALPDLRGRTMVSIDGQAQGVQTQVGKSGGSESVVLTLAQAPAHSHTLQGTTATATTGVPTNAYYAKPAPPPSLPSPPASPPVYGPGGSATALNPTAITGKGGGQPHENRQPFMALVHCIAIFGLWPQHP